MSVDTWVVANTSTASAALASWASVATVSNGYLGLRGQVSEFRGDGDAGTVVAGVFDAIDAFALERLSTLPRAELDPAGFEHAGVRPALATLPDPLWLRLRIDGRAPRPERGVTDFVQSLDLRRGLYRCQYDYRDGWGRTTRVHTERLASLAHPHRAVMRVTITALDHDDTPIEVESGIDGSVRAAPLNARHFTIQEHWADPPHMPRMTVRTRDRGVDVLVGVTHNVRGAAAPPLAVADAETIASRYAWRTRRGAPVVIDRFIAVCTSEDVRHRAAARLEDELDASAAAGWDAALGEHVDAWARLWDDCDVQIDGDDPAQIGLRFCVHHLLAAAPRLGDRLSVPARLLSGTHYQGAVFYDTDAYVLPFYTLTQPAMAERCLRFRCEGLAAGRRTARSLGLRGAALPWQAGPQGEECLGQWYRFARTNIFVNGVAAQALIQYLDATGDARFLGEHGLDLLVESARYYLSRASSGAGDALEFAAVSGPDTGHCPSDHNFFVAEFARHTLRWAADAVDDLAHANAAAASRAAARLGLAADEPQQWRRAAERIAPARRRDGVIEQCRGFFDLAPPPPGLFDRRDRWHQPVFGTRAIHQPDVLAALALLPHLCDDVTLESNRAAYEPLCLNDASVSHAVAARVAARLGDLAAAYQAFVRCIGMDLDESLTSRRDTHLGLHGAAMGGGWCAAIFGFAGVAVDRNGLRVSPRLPPGWSAMRFRLMIGGAGVRVGIDAAGVELTREAGGGGLDAQVGPTPLSLKPGESTRVPYARAATALEA